MIECGLGVIVVCLPTLRPLYGKISPESIFSGIRSVFSLRSLSIRSGKEPNCQDLNSLDRSAASSLSRWNFRSDGDGTMLTSVVGAHDLESQDNLMLNGIEVKHEVVQY